MRLFIIRAGRGNGEGVGLWVGAIQKVRRVSGNTMVVEMLLIVRDRAGSGDDVCVRVDAQRGVGVLAPLRVGEAGNVRGTDD